MNNTISEKTDIFIKKAQETHGDFYDYSQVKYKSAHQKVIIICPNHGEFNQAPHEHINQKCPKCAQESSGINRRLGKDIFIIKAKQIHKEKYNYEKVHYVGNKIKVLIICNYHNAEFLQSPNAHLRGQGCPNCKKEKLIKNNPSKNKEIIKKIHQIKLKNNSYGKSSIEEMFAKKLDDLKINYKRQFIENIWAIDFFLPDYNYFIQIDGIYYHGLDRPIEEIKLGKTKTDINIYKTYLRDLQQNKWFCYNNKNLIRITDKSVEKYISNNVLDIYYSNNKHSLIDLFINK